MYEKVISLINHYSKAYSKITIKKIETILESDSELINQLDEYGRTFLHYAVSMGDAELVSMLINIGGIEFNIQDFQGNTPMHIAVSQNKEDIINLLGKMPMIDINCQNSLGKTPLHSLYRLSNDNIQLLKNRLDAELYIEDKNGNTPMSLLSNENDSAPDVYDYIDIDAEVGLYEPIIHCLLERKPILLASLLEENDSKSEQIVNNLLIKSPSFISSQSQNISLLAYAIYTNQFVTANILIKYGANAESIDNFGNTIMFNLFKYEDFISSPKEVMFLAKLLNSSGADVNALCYNKPIEELLQNNGTMAYNICGLHLSKGNLNSFTLANLVNLGLDMNRPQDNHGNTILHYFISNYDVEMIDLSVKLGANPSFQNAHGIDCFKYLKQCTTAKNFDIFPQVVEILERANTMLNFRETRDLKPEEDILSMMEKTEFYYDDNEGIII